MKRQPFVALVIHTVHRRFSRHRKAEFKRCYLDLVAAVAARKIHDEMLARGYYGPVRAWSLWKARRNSLKLCVRVSVAP